MESFLDDYQLVRLVVGVSGMVLLTVFVLGGWWQWGSPAPNLVAVAAMAGHAAWCRFRHIRAPRQMLLLDITLVGASMLSIPDLPSMTTAFYGLLALVVGLFTERWWRAGLFGYLTVWYVAAFLNGPGVSVDSIAALVGNFVAVTAGLALMIRLRGWMGRLDANRSQMLGTVSHELRNNLTGVLGLTDVVANMEDLEPAEAQELITMANQQALDATDIVDDLLTASRLERTVLTADTSRVDTNAEVVTTARRFQGAGTDIELALATELPSATGDPLRIRQTLRNLISNAIRYGGPDINILTRHVGATIEIVVGDNGNGVPPEDENTIFLPYRRSTQGRRDAASVGLGLWICHQLAQTMGGSLTYRRDNDWTEFILTVPAAPPELNPATAHASNPTTRRPVREASQITRLT